MPPVHHRCLHQHHTPATLCLFPLQAEVCGEECDERAMSEQLVRMAEALGMAPVPLTPSASAAALPDAAQPGPGGSGVPMAAAAGAVAAAEAQEAEEQRQQLDTEDGEDALADAAAAWEQ